MPIQSIPTAPPIKKKELHDSYGTPKAK